jgi:hypothetical protein
MREPTAVNKNPTSKRRGFRRIRILGIAALLLAVLIVAAPWIVAAGLRGTAINSILAGPSVTASSDGGSFGWFSPLCISALLLAVLILAAPWIVAHTGLRDTAINSILARPNVTASSDRASFGWISPLSVHGLHFSSTNNHLDVRVEDITAERSLWHLCFSAPDLGTIKVEKPHVRLELPFDVPEQIPHRLEPTFTAMAKDAALTVCLTGQDGPVIDVEDINFTLRVEKAEEGSVLTLDPMVIFDRRKLTPKLASRLLHLFDPTMSDNPQISGSVSLSLDKLRLPIGVSRERAV